MTTAPKKAIKSLVDSAQRKILQTAKDLQYRREHGEANIVDTYEFGFISAIGMLNSIYNLDIDFGEEESE